MRNDCSLFVFTFTQSILVYKNTRNYDEVDHKLKRNEELYVQILANINCMVLFLAKVVFLCKVTDIIFARHFYFKMAPLAS